MFFFIVLALCPRLVTSSGVADLFIFYLRDALFVRLSSFSLAFVIPILQTCSHLLFGDHLLIFHGMFTSSVVLAISSSVILITLPCHLSSFSQEFCWTLALPWLSVITCSIRILSLLVIPHEYLTDVYECSLLWQKMVAWLCRRRKVKKRPQFRYRLINTPLCLAGLPATMLLECLERRQHLRST